MGKMVRVCLSVAVSSFLMLTDTALVPKWVRGSEFAMIVSPRVQELHMLGLGGSVGSIFLSASTLLPPLTASCDDMLSSGTPNGAALVAPALVVKSFDDLTEQAKQNRCVSCRCLSSRVFPICLLLCITLPH